MTEIKIPNSVTYVGQEVFANCSRLTSLIVDPGNQTYDSRDNCNSIIETATNTLIQGCSNSIIPNSVTKIGEEAFRYCRMTSVVIPNSVEELGNYAFSDCSGINSLTISNSVLNIGECAFWNCSGLTSLVIPNSVKEIGYNAFNGCSKLTSLSLGNSISKIGSYAFWNCNNISDVYSYAIQAPQIESSTFSNATYSNAKLHILEGATSYQTATGWSQFESIEEDLPNGIENIYATNYNDIQNKFIYNIVGQKLPIKQKGINIFGGKKILR